MSREDYEEVLKDTRRFRDALAGLMQQYPELFPPEMADGYDLYGLRRGSAKMPEVRLRRICLKVLTEAGQRQVYTVVPSFGMPYRTGYADEVEKALFLRRFGVPYWALTYLFGHNDRYWERMVAHRGRNDLVGTTLKDPDKLPEHVLADEKHTRLNGEKAYLATPVAEDCVWGASLALAADECF
jgi:hypothetical protein